jgi:hypothetical protein
MSNVVIVAIPAEDDYIHKISSEKVPHLSLLFLGETLKVKNLTQILNFVGHAADRSLYRFGLEVDRRGELGEEKADVLFFSKSKYSGFEEVNDFRSYLLQDQNIRTAYDSTEQFPEWIPHLTLGYPDTPAKPDDRDYPGFYYINFDRIAVWFGEYEGIEFPLNPHRWDTEVAMDNVTTEVVPNLLAHYGVKGMRWGVRRRASVGPQEIVVSDRRKKLKTSGGRGFPAHSDAVRARTVGQKGRASGIKSLSNEELSEYAKRLNLEQNVKRLQYNDAPIAKKFALTLVGRTGQQQAQEVANQAASKQVAKLMARAAKK